jgi:trehalose/maltose transport system permease protein
VDSKLFNLPFALKITVGFILTFWCLIAIFPLLWIIIMSIKLPVDSFASNPLEVILGPATKQQVGGLSILNIFFFSTALLIIYNFYNLRLSLFAFLSSLFKNSIISFFLSLLIYIFLFYILFFVIQNNVSFYFNLIVSKIYFLNFLSSPIIGFTSQHYVSVWFDNEFYKQFLNTMMVTVGVVSISLTVGTLAGYGLARSNSMIAFWLLILALILRALPHSVLVTGYLEPFIEYGLYGKKTAVIILLVAINQPFTIWMLRSFFMNIPQDLDEAAQIDGCNPFQAFWKVIMPLMWPGVITTGLFSFLLAYNDYLVAALLLDGQSQTMVPAIMQYFNMETKMTDLVEAIAAAASITAPLFLLVLFFQKQIVSGLTQGAVKG